jgi:hypothetical protein
MTLSLAERRGLAKLKKLQEIASVYTELESAHPTIRSVILMLSTHHIVVGHIVKRYTAMDELLNSIIIAYFFGQMALRTPLEAKRPTKLRIFRQHLLDEMYLLKKMQIIHAIQPLSPKVSEHLRKLNAIRNAMTHSTNPEHRKEYAKAKKVTYGGKDIFTLQGLALFEADWLATRKVLDARIPQHSAWTARRSRKLLKEFGAAVEAPA